MTHALMLGGPEHLGWGMDRHIAASVFDAVNQNTLATGSWKKGKAPKFQAWPRPGAKKKRKRKKRSVGELYAALTGARPDVARLADKP